MRWLLRFRKLDMTQPEQRQALVDTFINAIYLYDDKVLITFNYKEGTETVAFGEAVKAEKSSDMSAQGAPDIKRQIERFGVFFFYAGKRLHTFCTPFAHLPESRVFLRMACTACFPYHSAVSREFRPHGATGCSGHLHCSGIRVHLQGFIRIIFGFHRDGIAGDRESAVIHHRQVSFFTSR